MYFYDGSNKIEFAKKETTNKLLWSGTHTAGATLSLGNLDDYSAVLVCANAYAGEQMVSQYIPKDILRWTTTNAFAIGQNAATSLRRILFHFTKDSSNEYSLVVDRVEGTSGYMPTIRYVYGIK